MSPVITGIDFNIINGPGKTDHKPRACHGSGLVSVRNYLT
jgi:hypothetical protein